MKVFPLGSKETSLVQKTLTVNYCRREVSLEVSEN
jgi:hypothetical protein